MKTWLHIVRRGWIAAVCCAALFFPGLPGSAAVAGSLSDILSLPSSPPHSRAIADVPAKDPFRPAVERPLPAPAESAPAPEPEQVIPPLRLTAVLSGPRSAAVVEGRIVHVGDEIAGATVTRIGRREVWLEKDGKTVSLLLKENLYTGEKAEGK